MPASLALCRAVIRNATVLAVPFRRRRCIPIGGDCILFWHENPNPQNQEPTNTQASLQKPPLALVSKDYVYPVLLPLHPHPATQDLPTSRSVCPPLLSVCCPVVFASQPSFSHVSCSSLFFPKDYFHPVLVSLCPPSMAPKVRRSSEASVSRCSAFAARWCLHLSPPRLSYVSCSFPRFPLFPSSHPCQPQL